MIEAEKVQTTAERVEALLVGAIDPHVHSGPSIAERGVDHLELAQDASKAGFAAIIARDHDYSGVMTAALIARHHPELRTKVYSSIVLNNVIGGFNAYAVEHTAAMGGKIVFMPTLAAENHLRWQKASGYVHGVQDEALPCELTIGKAAGLVAVVEVAGFVTTRAAENANGEAARLGSVEIDIPGHVMPTARQAAAR